MNKKLTDIEIMNIIIKVVCNYYKLPYDALSRDTMKREIVEPRQIAHRYSVIHTKKTSLEAIGKYIGNRRHCTVINSIKKVDNFIDTDKKYAENFREIGFIISNFLYPVDQIVKIKRINIYIPQPYRILKNKRLLYQKLGITNKNILI